MNSGKFSNDIVKGAPKRVTKDTANVVQIINVIGYYEGKWLRFDNYDLAKKIMPPNMHHMIFSTIAEMQEMMGAKRMMEIGRQFKCKSALELWGKLHMNAYDPLVKYADILQMEKSRTVRSVKRYKKKVAYKFNFFEDEPDVFAKIYDRLPPQACAILDIFKKACKTQNKNHFTEDEMQGIINLCQADLHTRQDPWRIFQYYRGKLIVSGIMRNHHD